MTRDFGGGDFGEEYVRDDAFLDALSSGVDPSDGSDPLAAALLGLKQDVDRPMPAAPTVIPVAPVAPVASLDDVRARRRTANPWVAGVVGAAAASVAIVGTGAAVYGTQSSANETTMVELATTLDELEAANQSGDMEAARSLLEQARGLMAGIKMREARNGEDVVQPAPRTVTETTTVVEVHEVEVPPSVQQPAPAPEQNPAPAPENAQPPAGAPAPGSDAVAPSNGSLPPRQPQEQPRPTVVEPSDSREQTPIPGDQPPARPTVRDNVPSNPVDSASRYAATPAPVVPGGAGSSENF